MITIRRSRKAQSWVICPKWSSRGGKVIVCWLSQAPTNTAVRTLTR